MYQAYLIIVGTGVAVGTVARQVRLHIRDRDDRCFFRHVFDQTRSTDGGHGFVEFIHERRPPDLIARPKPGKAEEDCD